MIEAMTQGQFIYEFDLLIDHYKLVYVCEGDRFITVTVKVANGAGGTIHESTTSIDTPNGYRCVRDYFGLTIIVRSHGFRAFIGLNKRHWF